MGPSLKDNLREVVVHYQLQLTFQFNNNQTGVAQRHFNGGRARRERMPGGRPGQLCSYPQRRWHKRRYQYLQYFMLPRHLRYQAQAERSSLAQQDQQSLGQEDGNSQDKWDSAFMYEDDYALQDPGSEPESDSDFEYEGRGGKRKGKKAALKSKTVRQSGGRSSKRFDEDKPALSDRKFTLYYELVLISS